MSVDRAIKRWEVFKQDEEARDIIAMELLIKLIGEMAPALNMRKAMAIALVKNKYKEWKYFCTKTVTYNGGSIEEYDKALFGAALVVLNSEDDFGKKFCKAYNIPYNKYAIKFIVDHLESTHVENSPT